MANGRHVQYLVAAAVSLGAVVSGVVVGWATPVIPKFHDNETGIIITDNEISWVAALGSPGFMLGSLLTRFISDSFGRRVVILGSVVPFTVGAIIILTTLTPWWLYMTKLLWGSSVGMLATVFVSSIYLAEVSDKEIRGRVTSPIRYMRSFGIFLIMSVGPFISYDAINYMILALPIGYLVACCFIPESPYYLLKEGKINAARDSLIKLSGDQDPKVIEDRLSAMRVDVKQETQRSGSVKELFTGKRYRKALIICTGLKITLVLSGSLAIQQYFGAIIQESKTDVDISTLLIIYGAFKFVIGIFSSAIMDKVGRRPLLIHSYLSSGITLIIVGAYFLIQPTSSPYYTYIPFIGIILASTISTLGYETLVHVVIAEIFPLNVKSVAMTFQNILGGFLNFFSVLMYQRVKNVAGLSGVFWFYASVSISGAVFSYFIVLETKGKSLREIQVELQGALYDQPELKAIKVDDPELEKLKSDDTLKSDTKIDVGKESGE